MPAGEYDVENDHIFLRILKNTEVYLPGFTWAGRIKTVFSPLHPVGTVWSSEYPVIPGSFSLKVILKI